MSTIGRDPLWIVFPRWIEESGLPETIASDTGESGWLIFRKLVELDCDVNLTPHWFDFSLNDLARWTGIPSERLNTLLEMLERGNWIERYNLSLDAQTCRIITPLKVPLEESQIRTALSGNHSKAGNFVLRYYQNTVNMSSVENVIYLYQMLFGARFSPRIVEDLEEIANTYDMGVIYDIFSEAYAKKVKSLAWIKSHLHSIDRDKEEEKKTSP